MKNIYLGAVIAGALIAMTGCGNSAENPVEASTTNKPPTSADANNGSRIATPPSKAVAVPVTIPEGTPIKVRTTTALSTESVESGATFRATLAQPLIVDGKEIAPANSDVDAVVVNADKGGRVKGVASISVRLTKLYVDDAPVAIKTGAYTKEARATKKNDAVKVGIGAGIGAAIGAIAGGGKGAAIGAGAGGAAGTGVVLATRGEPAVIAAESLLTFRLTAPVTVN